MKFRFTTTHRDLGETFLFDNKYYQVVSVLDSGNYIAVNNKQTTLFIITCGEAIEGVTA
jgi:hypothetical protein